MMNFILVIFAITLAAIGGLLFLKKTVAGRFGGIPFILLSALYFCLVFYFATIFRAGLQ